MEDIGHKKEEAMSTRDFWLGEVVETHRIAGSEVIEYHPRKSDGSLLLESVDESAVRFSVEDHNISFYTLPEATVYVGLVNGGGDINTVARLVGVLFSGIS